MPRTKQLSMMSTGGKAPKTQVASDNEAYCHRLAILDVKADGRFIDLTDAVHCVKCYFKMH